MVFEPSVPKRLEALTKVERYAPELSINVKARTVGIDPQGYVYCFSNGGVPADQYYGYVQVFPVTAEQFGELCPVDWEAFEKRFDAGEFDPLVNRIFAGTEIVWDGNNHVARFDQDAQTAIEKLTVLLTDVDALPDGAGVWDAADWFQHTKDEIAVRPESTDEELTALAQELQDEAGAENIVVEGIGKWLEDLREERMSYAEEAA